MDRRIRVVWALSLVSALVVIGVQGYWLYSQYCYVVDAFCGELARRVWLAGDREYGLREAAGGLAGYRYFTGRDVRYGGGDSVRFGARETRVVMMMGAPGDSSAVRFAWRPDMPEDSLLAGIRRMIVNRSRPFCVERFDSVLSAVIPDMVCRVRECAEGDWAAGGAATGQVVLDAMFELDNLSAYLNKLRDMVRADSVATPLRIVSFDLRELTERVIRLAPLPPGRGVSLSAVYELGPSPFVEADPVHLANILDNLIENAVKYSAGEVSVEIRAVRRGCELLLSVSDRGIGILPHERGRVFDKFFRGSNLPDRQIPGLGLGLSYVKLITEAHGGRVSLHGRSGGGTSAVLIFPQ